MSSYKTCIKLYENELVEANTNFVFILSLISLKKSLYLSIEKLDLGYFIELWLISYMGLKPEKYSNYLAGLRLILWFIIIGHE